MPDRWLLPKKYQLNQRFVDFLFQVSLSARDNGKIKVREVKTHVSRTYWKIDDEVGYFLDNLELLIKKDEGKILVNTEEDPQTHNCVCWDFREDGTRVGSLLRQHSV